MVRDWFWQLEALGQGPDYHFIARFAPADAAHLAARVLLQPLPGFVQYQASHLIDERNAAQVLANIAHDQPRNLWMYHSIQVREHELVIERGYGGYPGAHGSTETELLVALASDSALSLQQWGVSGGGDGYAAVRVASGTTAAELLDYLRV